MAGASNGLTAAQAQGDNCLTSTVPASWLRAGSFPYLWQLGLALNQLVGTIPDPQPYSGLYPVNVSATPFCCPAGFNQCLSQTGKVEQGWPWYLMLM